MPSQAPAFASRRRFQRGIFPLVALFATALGAVYAQIEPEDLPEELKLEAAEIQRVNSIIIPEIAANQTPLVSFLRDIEEKSKKYDKTGRGLRLSIAPDVEKSLEGRVVTWKAKDVPAPNAMQLATYLSWVNARIRGDVFEVIGPMTAIKTWEGADGEMHDEATLAALRSRIIPKIEWKEVAIPTALEGLSQLSRDPDNGAKAVKFEFAATVSKEVKENVLTLNLHWVPLLEALGYICNLSNLDYKVFPGRVEFVVAKPQEETSAAEMKKSLMKMDGGPGSEAEKTRLSKLVLKRVQFKDAKILDVLTGIVDASRKDDPTGKGVKLVYFLVGPKDKELRLSLDLTDAPVTKVLDAIAEIPELFYVIEGNQVKVSPVKAGENGNEVIYPGNKDAK